MRDDLNATGPTVRGKDMYYRILEIDKPIIQYKSSEIAQHIVVISLPNDMYKVEPMDAYRKFLIKFRVDNSGVHPDVYAPKLEKAEKAFHAKPVSKAKTKK